MALVARDAHIRKALAEAFLTAPRGWKVSLHEQAPASADVIVSHPAQPGAVPFDAKHPNEALEEVAKRLTRGSLVFAVTSPSGGTGATTLALQLTAEFARLGRTSCFVDLDTEWGVRSRLGLDEKCVRWARSRDDHVAARSVPLPGGFRALLPPEDMDLDDSSHMVESASAGFERVVVDAPAPALERVVGIADGVLVVMSPTPTGAVRARTVLERYPEHRCAVVVNRLGRGGEISTAGLARMVGYQIGLELPCCAQVRDAEDLSGLPAGGWTRWERRVAQLARALDSC